MPLLSQAHNSITQTLDTAVQNGAPGLVFHAIDKSGHTLISHATGTLGASTPSSMNASQTLFWIAACTKLITAIAVLQLVEQGKIPLDDEKWVGEIAPEIKAKEVFRAGKWGAGEEQKRGVTMSMLLSHTAGFAYRCIDVRCGDEEDEQGWLEGAGGDVNDILESRMVNQPGSAWEYGINLDWAGIILERVTNQTLGSYFQTHIFTPLGITAEAATFFPSASAQETHVAKMHQRDSTTGVLHERPHLYHGPLSCTPEKQALFFQSGGAGLWSTPAAYVKILASLLNNGTCPKTHARILTPPSVDLLFTNQIPSQPDFARGNPASVDASLMNHEPEIYPQQGDPPQGWGYGGFLTLEKGDTGRGREALWWTGFSNCFWWLDRERGVAGMLAAQVFPSVDVKMREVFGEVEKGVYDGLVGE